METHRKAGCDARERHRAGQERTLLAASLGIEISASTSWFCAFVPDGRIHFPLVHELGGEHAAGRLVPGHRLAVGRQGFIQDRERIAASQVTVEIDVCRKHLGELRRHRIRNSGCVGGVEQGVANGAAAQAGLRSQGGRLDAGHELLTLAGHPQPGEMGAELRGVASRVSSHQFVQFTRCVGARLDHLAAASRQQLACDAVAAQEHQGLRVIDVQAAQQAVCGVAGLRDVAAEQ